MDVRVACWCSRACLEVFVLLPSFIAPSPALCSLVLRYTKNEFMDGLEPTIGE